MNKWVCYKVRILFTTIEVSMKKYILILGIFSLLLSCKKEKEYSIRSYKEHKNVSPEKPYNFNKDSIFGVYQITDKDFAICIPVQFDNEDLPFSREYGEFIINDSIPWIYGKDMKDYKYYDTLFIEKWMYNERFENIFKNKISESFFVYGTKSFQKCKVKKVVFKSNECGNDYIAYILNINKKIVGHPLIASEEKIPLNYGNDYSKINNSFKKEISGESTQTTYGLGKYRPTVFANYGNLYFSYYDDFKWYIKNSNSECQFPDRCAFETDSKNKIHLLWNSEMDLLGLPCL